MATIRIVADLGNSRLKWGRLDRAGGLEATIALPTDDPSAWAAAMATWAGGEATSWAIASVNPPVADRLRAFLEVNGVGAVRWYRSAADVPVRHTIEHPGTAGADRALAVLAAVGLQRPGRPGLVVSCGTAVTVERIGADGTWQGGAIAPGAGLSAQALHRLTAQLPLVNLGEAPGGWGRSTRPALEAGVFWGTVGSIRELLTRGAEGLDPTPWLVWTGGEADRLARWIAWPGARIVPDLVLIGLAGASVP